MSVSGGYTSIMKINRKLIWDYEFSEKDQERESFRRWYVARVLTQGGIQDIRDVGIKTVHDILPKLFLPKKIRAFWEWYFSPPEIQGRYGNSHPAPQSFHP